jgi:hypothetical protein
VELLWNDPHVPQQNGVVERTRGVSKRRAEPQTCRDLQELQSRLRHEDRMQREEYPAIDGMSRKQAFPALWHSGRGYSEGWERHCWDLRGALSLLARYKVRRKVSGQGQVSAYHRLIRAGGEHAGCWVYPGLDARTAEWVISGVGGEEICRRPAPGLTREAIVGLKAGKG